MDDCNPIPPERLTLIGETIVATVENYTRDWERLSRSEQPNADEERRQQLRDAIPEFLTAFGEGLRDALETGNLTRRYAIEHGLQRWELDWSITELLRDFMILRRCILRDLRERLELTADEAETLAAMFDEAAADSVRAYSEEREERLRSLNAELKASNYELKRFANVVAHEIRSPLSTIQIAARLIARQINDNSEELNMVQDAANFINTIVNDTLNYAQLGTKAAAAEAVDLNHVFEDALAQVADPIRKTRAEISSDPLPTVSGHRHDLLQLFINLLQNAMKYSTDPPRIHISAQDQPGCHILSFRDEGIGIAPEHQQSIFRFLTRVDPHGDAPGSGIGLAICRRVAERHGGRIWVESELGQGSIFYLELPAAQAPSS